MTSIAAVWQKAELPSPRRRRRVPGTQDTYVKPDSDFLRHDLPLPVSLPLGSAQPPLPPAQSPREALRRGAASMSGRRKHRAAPGTGFADYILLAAANNAPPFATRRISPGTPRGRVVSESVDCLLDPTSGHRPVASGSLPSVPVTPRDHRQRSSGEVGGSALVLYSARSRGSVATTGWTTFTEQPLPKYRDGRFPEFPQVRSVYGKRPDLASMLEPDYGKDWTSAFDGEMNSPDSARLNLARFEVTHHAL
jgi:hypothetical protein